MIVIPPPNPFLTKRGAKMLHDLFGNGTRFFVVTIEFNSDRQYTNDSASGSWTSETNHQKAIDYGKTSPIVQENP